MAEKADKKQAADKNGPKNVTLKRTVTIKALVTDKFKEYMNFEIQAGLQNFSRRLGQIESQVKRSDLAPVVREKLTLEKDQLTESMNELTQRQNQVKDLENGTYYPQGMIDGFVTVSVGDNLYEKLGAMEITVEDGIVKTISPTGVVEQFNDANKKK